MDGYILELLITIQGDDKLALEAAQATLGHQVDLLSGEFNITFRPRLIRVLDPEKERDFYFKRGLVTAEEAARLWNYGS